MKKSALILLFSVVISSINAQTIETDSKIRIGGLTEMNVILDYSIADIAGLSFDDFVDMQNEDDEKWNSVEKEWKKKFLREANDKLYRIGLTIGTFKSAICSLKIKFYNISPQGNIICDCYFVNPKGEDLGVHKRIRAKGGHVGSVVNLVGDGHEKLGKKVGQYLLQLKKIQILSIKEQEEQELEKQKRQANNTANKYYIAWLTKSGKLTKNKDKLSELEQLYPNQEIIKIIDFFDIDELEQLAVYHDLEFERFAK